MERPFNIRQNRPVKIILSVFLFVAFLSCGGQSPSTNNSGTGSFAVSLQWPEDAPTLETSYSTARQAAVDCDAAGIVTITFAFYDENENFLIDDEWSCSLHIGTVYGIPAGSNRHLVVTGKDASGTVLYQGEKFGITITSGETTDGGIVEMMPAVVQKWAKTYGGVNDEDIEAIQTLSGGGYIVAARTQSFGFGDPDPEIGNTDIWILKLNANGSVAWEKSYGGSGSDFFGEVILQTSDSGFITTGYTASFGDWVEVGWILKLNADGTIAWQKTYGDYWQEIDAILEIDGGYLAAGHYYNTGTYSGDLWIMKLNATNGNVIWSYTYPLGSSYEVTVKSLISATDGGYIVAGQIDSDGSNIWIVKINDNGTIVWQKTYGDYGESIGHIQPTSDGGYIVVGTTTSFGAGGQDIWILKLDKDGGVTWQKTYGGTSNDIGEEIIQTSDGGYIAAGETSSYGAGGSDIIVLRLESDGSTLWRKTYGTSSGHEESNGILTTADGGYIVAGETEPMEGGSEDLWILKMDSDGSVGDADCGIGSDIVTIQGDTTSVSGIDTDASRSAYNSATADTDVTPQSTSATVTTQCE